MHELVATLYDHLILEVRDDRLLSFQRFGPDQMLLPNSPGLRSIYQ